MNAYQLFEAAFDPACDDAEASVEYVQQYADGAFDLYVSDETAQKIVAAKVACDAATAENGEGPNNLFQIVQQPLETIEL